MLWMASNIFTRASAPAPIASVDVLVAGGGAAGVAAATTAAAQGLRVAMIERYGFVGGNAVAGLSGTICGMFLASEGRNRPVQVVHGFTSKFYDAMSRAGGVTAPQRYGKTWTVTHDPLVWREVGEALLLEQNVKIFYHTLIVGVIVEDRRVCGLVVAAKNGLASIEAKIVIDATGDADVLSLSGLDYTLGDNGHVQNPTMIFRIAGVDTQRFSEFWGPDTIGSPKVSEMIKQANASGTHDLPRTKIWLFPTPQPNQLLCNCTRVIGRDGRELSGYLVEDLTEAEIAGRRQVREYARFFRDNIPGCEDSYVVDTGVQVGIRQSRSAVGIDRLSNDDVVSVRKRADGIARSPWPIELHAGELPRLHWILDDFYDIPYGALVPAQGENLLVAGRCLSAEHEALASARVTAQCFQYGQAAGLAAVESIRTGLALRALPGPRVRELMNADGARLGE